ncbi:MAG: hypothetical protein AB7O43_02650 [Hyphomicrobiaceae bacterium]
MLESISLANFLTAENIVVILGFLGGILTYLLNARYQRAYEKRQQTYQLLSRIFEDGPVARSRVEMAKWVAQGRTIDTDVVDSATDEVILSIIDFYEFVCEGAIARGTVDADLLDREAGGRIERYFLSILGYVRSREHTLTRRQSELGHAQGVVLYRNIRRFLKEYRGVDVDRLIRTPESSQLAA